MTNMAHTQLDLSQIDKLERDLFISKIESALPPTEAEVSLLSKALDHADLRLVDGLHVVEIYPSERTKSSDSPISPVVPKEKRNLRISAAGSFARKKLPSFLANQDQKLKWSRIQGGDDFAIKKYTKFVKDGHVKWGKATTTVHTSPEEALAWLWDYCSNERMRGHQKKNGNTLRKYYDPETQQRKGSGSAGENQEWANESRTRHVVIRTAVPKTFDTRESNAKLVW